MGQIDVSLHSFVEEMKLQGVWSGVTIVTASEFGRTITSNGAGTDHGWGGISLLASGSLRGATVFGQYPHDLSDASSLNVGRGRLIPTLSWEALWSGVASWFGVPDSLLEQVLPNLPNFPNTSLLNASQLYRL
jgi:cullin-associated NEDD8-dissociated protein 1